MTHEERLTRVAHFGFTARQAAFLVEVMLHSGVFLGRQYCAFARASSAGRSWSTFSTS